VDGPAVAVKLVEHRPVRQRHALLQTGRAGGVLQQDDVVRRTPQAAQRLEIWFDWGDSEVTSNRGRTACSASRPSPFHLGHEFG